MTHHSGPPWICTACDLPLSARDRVFNQALGRQSHWSCLPCLAQAKGLPLQELERTLRAHVARRDCLSRELEAAEGAVGIRSPWSSEALDTQQVRRYSRQLSLPQVGDEGQKRLAQARVLVLGAGGLGSPVALYLAAAGVGTLAVADDDRVELSNLQRQILHGTEALGELKVQSAARRLSDLNPNVRVEPLALRLEEANARSLVADYDVVVDGLDSLESRYALNRACVRARKPWVHGAILRFYGQVTVFEAGGRPCYHCLFAETPETVTASCEAAGVMGAVAGVVGSIQAMATLKLLLGVASSLEGVLWTWDGWAMSSDRMRYQAESGCPVCGG